MSLKKCNENLLVLVAMSNWGNNNASRQQKKRTFIYNAPTNRPAASNSARFPRPSSSTHFSGQGDLSTRNVPSPCKKIKSSHDEIASDKAAAEELFRDLPLEAFDDEDLGDEFEIEDELSADELCQAASLAEQAAGTQTEKQPRDRKSITSHPDMYNRDVDLVSHQEFDVSDDLEMLNEIDKISTDWSSKTVTEAHSSGAIPSSSARGTAILFSGKSESMTSKVYARPSSEMNRSSQGSQEYVVPTSSSRNNGATFYDSRIQGIQKELRELKEKYNNAESQVQSLEEEKYGKDGELKMLRDSLAHFQAEEAKKRDQIRSMEEKKQRDQSEKEKELQKQVEALTTRLTFKEQEITQVKEQMNKQASVAMHVGEAGPSKSPIRKTSFSPHRKKSSVCNSTGIPMGSSFFEKVSPELKCSPKTRKSPGSQGVLDKNSDNSDNSFSETTKTLSEISSALDEATTEVFSKAKKSVTMDIPSKAPQLELLQKLFRVQNAEVCNLDEKFKVKTDDETLVSLLRTSQKPLQSDNIVVKKSEDLDVPPTLLLFETQLTKTTQSSSSSGERTDYKVNEATLAFETINDLLNCESSSSLDTERKLNTNLENLTSESSMMLRTLTVNQITSATGLLPLLESHILLYSDLRMELGDDSLSSTGSGYSQIEPGEHKEAPSPDSECAHTLSEARTNAANSLRCLNVLVLYSQALQDIIFKSGHISSDKEEEIEECPKTEETDTKSSGSSSLQLDLLAAILKLLVLQPNEPLTVIHQTLPVLASLAKYCPPKYQSRLFPLLTDGLLVQCLSKDWSPLMFSQVLSILTHMAKFNSAVLTLLCPQTDDCILIKMYQDLTFEADDMSRTSIQQQVVDFLNVLLSRHGEALSLLLHSDCPCNMEIIKSLVVMLYAEIKFLQQFDADSLMECKETRSVLMLVRQGMFLLSTLCTNDRLFVEHRLEVEHQFANIIRGTAMLFNALSGIPESEVLALQDMSDLEPREDMDILHVFGDEEETENMDIDG